MALDTTTSGPNADSYVTAADFLTYAESMGFIVSEGETAQEAALRRSAMFLDTSWAWDGQVADEDQSRAFPRGDDTEVHKNIRDAQCELAIRVLAGDDIFQLATGRQVKSEMVKIDGAVTESFGYEGGGAGGGAARAFPAVDALVRGFATGLSTASGGASSAMIGINK